MSKRPMPAERDGVTKKLQIGEDFQGYATVGLYPDGTPGEVFLTVQKAGSLEHGLSCALALMISLALQRGVPLADITDKLTGLKFEPAGVTGDRKYPMVSSFCDYLARWIEERFGEKANSNA